MRGYGEAGEAVRGSWGNCEGTWKGLFGGHGEAGGSCEGAVGEP